MAERRSHLVEYAKTQQKMANQQQTTIDGKSPQKAEQAVQQAKQAVQQAERIADKKERARMHTEAYKHYVEARLAEVQARNTELEHRREKMASVLAQAILRDPMLELDKLKQFPHIPAFDPGRLDRIYPARDSSTYAVPELSGIRKFLPSARKKYRQDVANALKRREIDFAEKQKALSFAKADYDTEVQLLLKSAETHNVMIDKLKQDFEKGIPDAICEYYLIQLTLMPWLEAVPQHFKLAFVAESKQLVVEFDLPTVEVIPKIGSFKYVKTKDEITETPRPMNDRKSLYASLIAQIALAILHTLFHAKGAYYVETIVLNGYVDSIDRSTGRPVRPCLVTVRTTRETFNQLDLSKVDPAACLKFLSASVSKSPAELTPVRPVLELNMVDSRFIEETDVISQLDQRPNLMDLSPKEFESLITNLFEKMGLETRQTQASRDGGVDCVAFDNRPIFGGKVVIQAKRYKNTVGVSAVRDLYGTVQNEGASKGILVTTSGYGEASYEFARGKPLELLSGSNLLALLADHAGIEAKIVMPEDWKDIHPDSSDNNQSQP